MPQGPGTSRAEVGAGPRATGSTTRRFRWLTLALSSVVTLALLELALRVLPVPDSFDERVRVFTRVLVEDDELLGHRLRPASRVTVAGVDYRTDARGCRAPDEPGEDAREGAARVLVVGDSVTMGWGVAELETFAARLRARLDASIASCGVLGYGVEQTTRRAEQLVVAWRPDIVVLGYYPNDPEDHESTLRRPWLHRSRLARRLRPFARGLRRRAGLSPDAATYYRELHAPAGAGWRRVDAALERFATACAGRRLKCVVALLPAHVGDPYPLADVHARLSARAGELGLESVDLADAVASLPARSLWVAPDDHHPNATAHARFAAALGAWLTARGWARDRT